MAKYIKLFHSKYEKYACINRSRRVPVSRKVYNLLIACDYGILFTLDGRKYYFVGCFREKDRVRYYGCVPTSPPLFFVQYQMKELKFNEVERLTYYMSYFDL